MIYDLRLKNSAIAPKLRGKSSILLSLVFCLLASSFLRATTVTGTLLDPQGNAISGKVTFTLTNYGSNNVPRVAGTNVIVNTAPISLSTSATGAFSGTIQGNDTITPAGTLYVVTFYNGAAVYLSGTYSITGTTLDLTSATPTSVIPAVPPNQAYTTVMNAGAALVQRNNLNFSGTGVSCADNTANSRTDCTVAAPMAYFGGCAGTAVSNGTTSLVNLGGVPNNGSCTQALTDYSGPLVTHACSLKNLQASSSANGVNASDGAVTVRLGSAGGMSFANTAITCTMGTGKNCSDTTHTVSATVGQQFSVQIVTQASSTLANLYVTLECQ